MNPWQTKLMTNKFGYYQIGNEIFQNKIQALLKASSTGLNPSWHFHDNVYKKINWQQDISIDLDTLYQTRVKQLREKYDYIIVHFSGGSDSWTILKSFFDAKLYPDEIFTRWPLSATQGKFITDANNLHPSNILSEWDLTIIPCLKEFEKWFPKTKITIYDWSEDYFNLEFTDDIWLKAVPGDYLNPGAAPKHLSVGYHERFNIDNNILTVVIDGIDKPQMCYADGSIYCYFLDKLANGHPSEIEGRNIEHFYWTPDLPEITVAQAQAIYRNLKINSKMVSFIDKDRPYDVNAKKIWDRYVRQIIYPGYVSRNFFQADKPFNSVFNEIDSWMYSNSHTQTKSFNSWKYVYNNIVNSIDQKYFDKKNDEIVGFCGFVDQFYYLGPITS